MLVGAVGLHVRVVVGTVDVISGLLDEKEKTSSLAYLFLTVGVYISCGIIYIYVYAYPF